jgi:hypothetical protein
MSVDFEVMIVTVEPGEPAVWVGVGVSGIVLALLSVVLVRWRQHAILRSGRPLGPSVGVILIFLLAVIPAALVQSLVTGQIYKLMYDVRGMVTVCTAFVPGVYEVPLIVAALAAFLEWLRIRSRAG